MESGENKMDSFLDTGVVIKYFEHDYMKEELGKRCYEYVKNIQNKILISFIVQEEAHRVILKRKEIYDYILNKIQDPSLEIEYKETVYMNKQEFIFAKDLYLKLKNENIKELKKNFDSEIDFLKASLDLFLKNKVNETAIGKSELDNLILSIVHNFIEDFADCRVLTSAIQMQQHRDIFFFVTADKHFDSGSYDFIENELKLKNYKKPQLKNLLYEN